MAIEPSREILENPFDQSVSLPLLLLRFAGAVVTVVALFNASPLLEWLSVVVVLWVLIVVWGRHILFAENLHALPNLRADAPSAFPSSELPMVSIVVPVRNEAVGVEAAVRALAAADYPRLEILVIDDSSTDATPETLQRLAREFSNISVLTAPPVPEGWTGKVNSSWFGFKQSNPDSGWLLFTDARVIFRPSAVLRTVAHAEANQLDFLSCILRFDGQNLAEELIAMIQNRGLVISARAFGGGPPLAPFAHGAFTLVRRRIYEATSGHARFPSHPIEDFMLGKTVQLFGAKTSAAIASDLLSLRRYVGLADIRRRLVRTFRISGNDSVADLVNRISLELLLNVMPVLLAFGGFLRLGATRHFDLPLAVMSCLAALGYLAGTRTPRSSRKICGVRSWTCWLHPLGAVLWIYLVLIAIGERLRRKPIVWRGRPVAAPGSVPCRSASAVDF